MVYFITAPRRPYQTIIIGIPIASIKSTTVIELSDASANKTVGENPRTSAAKRLLLLGIFAYARSIIIEKSCVEKR